MKFVLFGAQFGTALCTIILEPGFVLPPWQAWTDHA
jgi:hypothetical protein